MWTHAIAKVRYSLCTTPKLSFATANAVIFDIFKNRKYLDICINQSVLILILQQNINFRERIKEKRDRQADRQRDWQTDRRTDLHTFWQTKRHAAGVRKKKRMRPGEKIKEREKKDENERIPEYIIDIQCINIYSKVLFSNMNYTLVYNVSLHKKLIYMYYRCTL